MGFLVGNDFIPHLPNLHIASNALPLLYQTYIHVLPKLDGYINENGVINLKRFQLYLETLSSVSTEHLKLSLQMSVKVYAGILSRGPQLQDLLLSQR